MLPEKIQNSWIEILSRDLNPLKVAINASTSVNQQGVLWWKEILTHNEIQSELMQRLSIIPFGSL